MTFYVVCRPTRPCWGNVCDSCVFSWRRRSRITRFSFRGSLGWTSMCASTRANFRLRSVHPDLTDAFAFQHAAFGRVWTPSLVPSRPPKSGKVPISWADCCACTTGTRTLRSKSHSWVGGRLFFRGCLDVADWSRMQALRSLFGGNWQRHQQRGWRPRTRSAEMWVATERRRGWWNRVSFTLKFGLSSMFFFGVTLDAILGSSEGVPSLDH